MLLGLLPRILGGGLAVALLLLAVQTVRLSGEKRHSASLQRDLNEARAEIKRIADAGEESKARTERVIVQVEKDAGSAELRAQRVEKAPTVAGCRTPPEVMGADI